MPAPCATPVNTLDEAPAPLDVQHLDHNTFGDKGLKAEIISLFAVQLEQSRPRIADAATPDDWHFIMHTLKGAAAAVGALDIARLASAWDGRGLPILDADRDAILAAFDRAHGAFTAAAQASLAA
jgi:hypothetical protein